MSAHHWIRLLHQYVLETPRDPKRLFSKSIKITSLDFEEQDLLSQKEKEKIEKKKTKLLYEQSAQKNCNTKNAVGLITVCIVTWSSPVLHAQAKTPEPDVTCELPLIVNKNCKEMRQNAASSV